MSFLGHNNVMHVHFEKVLPARTQSFACREFHGRTFNAPFHFHPEFELTAILAGQGRRFVADSIETFVGGDLVLLGANVPHRWASPPVATLEPDVRWRVLQFRRDCLGATFWTAPELAALRRLLDRAARGLHFSGTVAGEIAPLLGELRTGMGARRIMALLEILERLAAATGRPLASRGYRVEVAARDAARIDRVISFVESSYADEELTLTQAARIAALTPGAFSRFFSRSTGRTFVNFVNEVRLSHVCRLLAGTERPVAEICFACGFGTMSNFHQRFREAKRMTPLEYRRHFHPAQQPIARRFSALPV